MIRTVIFDMDGVIIDSEPVHFKVEQQMFKELGISISFEKHAGFVGTSSQNMWEQIVKEYSLEASPGELTSSEYERYIRFLNENPLLPVKGVIELIEDLHSAGLKLMVASSSPLHVINRVLEKFRIGSFFSGIVSGTELEHSKPHPEIFLKTASLSGSSPNQCLVIEDSENGVIAARAAGMKCIGYRNPNSGPQNLGSADLVVNSFLELRPEMIRYV
jgi:HAD superfamily hydrolase (TIGR01509 family)